MCLQLRKVPVRKFFAGDSRNAILSFLCVGILLLPSAYGLANSSIAQAAPTSNAAGQSLSNLIWEKTYGGTGDDRAFYAAKTADGGFLIVGSSTSIFPGKTVGWMVRIDSTGNIIWNKTLSDTNGSEFRRVIKTENGFLLIGNSFLVSGSSNGMITQVDKEGNALWNLTIDEFDNNRLLCATRVDDGYVAIGFVISTENNSTSALIVKSTFDGKILWNKTYGQIGENAAVAVTSADNNSCVVAGYTNSSRDGIFDVWLFKIDKDGNPLWNHTFEDAESQKTVALTKAENGYLIVGERHSPVTDDDALMIKTDSEGAILWQNTFGGTNFDKPSDVISLSSGGYAITGFTFSWGKGERDFWLFKIDESGNVLWSCTQGREQFEEAYYVNEVADSLFVLIGWTNSIGKGKYDYYAVEIKVTVEDSGLFQNPFFYGAIGFSLAGFACVVFGVLYFEKWKRKKADSDKVQASTLT